MKSKRSNLWLMVAAIFQLTTAVIHSLSFIAEQQPANDIERQLVELINNYRMDMGAGIHRSFYDLFLSVSVCLSLICLFAGSVNLFLIKSCNDSKIIQGVTIINAVVFGIMLVTFILFAFLPPIICAGLICCSLILALIFDKRT